MEESELLLVIILIVAFPIALIAGIVFGIYYIKKRKRKKLLANLPSNVSFTASIRINSKEAQHTTFKLMAYESSGILYIVNDKAYIRGYKRGDLEFNLRTTHLRWLGMEFSNGILQWFSIIDINNNEYFINIDTGLLAFEIGNKMTTNELYTRLINEQVHVNLSPPPSPL
ncbi:hypothetical protein [Dysgonomonas sp. ZJ279]|uniref:hypothetical protein n=1 Tax=Dysgonomonas sp. ZJ279 TaxID=2709796 RepID=UPI0013EA34D2|nr:hypothetical protein [Dysgonomonas sp. ZJ279]